MLRFTCYIPGLFLLPIGLAAQQVTDTVRTLQQVTVSAYLSEQPLLRVPTSVSIIGPEQAQYQPGYSPVHILNTVPGVRMEERSPGSNRLSIRGSLLRSPFGVRNVKLYIDGFPLTDAGGNTYLNLIDGVCIRETEILKGPDGSLFGANSGGVVLFKTHTGDTTDNISAGMLAGMYGLFRQHARVEYTSGKNTFRITEAYQRSDGYRENSSFQRFFVQASDEWRYAAHNRFHVFAFYSDVEYRTPGGLTLEQYLQHPRSARPPTPVLPGAAQQKAGVFNQTVFGGLMHEARFTRFMKHVFAVEGSYTDFKNPFITNYETRKEYTYGIRTWLEFHSNPLKKTEWKFHVGAEWQNTHAHIRNYENLSGEKGELQVSDRILSTQYFFFARSSLLLFRRLTVEAGLSVNNYAYRFEDDTLEKRFEVQLMPRVGLSYKITNYLSVRASVTRGYSPPTIAEVRPSDNQVYTGLQPESGWNYEGGLRLNIANRFRYDIAAYHYRLDQAIVRRLNDNGTEYFVNSGGTVQTGVESEFSGWIIAQKKKGAIRGLQLHNSYTLNLSEFSNYTIDTVDYSGNSVTGIPQHVVITDITLLFPVGFYFFAEYNYTGKIPLNDANSVYADNYHLVRLKTGWKHEGKRSLAYEFYGGIDNLLNQQYSLGNDLNAAGGRYYNAAPAINFYLGAKITWKNDKN